MRLSRVIARSRMDRTADSLIPRAIAVSPVPFPSSSRSTITSRSRSVSLPSAACTACFHRSFRAASGSPDPALESSVVNPRPSPKETSAARACFSSRSFVLQTFLLTVTAHAANPPCGEYLSSCSRMWIQHSWRRSFASSSSLAYWRVATAIRGLRSRTSSESSAGSRARRRSRSMRSAIGQRLPRGWSAALPRARSPVVVLVIPRFRRLPPSSPPLPPPPAASSGSSATSLRPGTPNRCGSPRDSRRTGSPGAPGPN